MVVADAIGFSLWRYIEEKMEPPIAKEKMNVNRWTLRMVEDEEVDYDFPALERTKPINAFAFNNNRGTRSRSQSKPYDEVALVDATDDQFKATHIATPKFKDEAAATAPADDDGELTPTSTTQNNPVPLPTSINRPHPVTTTVISHRFPPAAPLDIPAAVEPTTAPRTGVSKIIR